MREREIREARAAQKAYEIYRGMKIDPRDLPHWDDLSREQRGLLEWVARFAMLSEGSELVEPTDRIEVSVVTPDA